MKKKKPVSKATTTVKLALHRVKDKTLSHEVKISMPTDSPESRKTVAFIARLGSSANPQYELNTAVIEDLASLEDWTQTKQIIRKVNGKAVSPIERLIYPEYIRARAVANDKNFFARLGRAISDRRGGLKTRPLKLFLLEHWDKIHHTDGQQLGLKFFTDEAVISFIEIVKPPGVGSVSLGAYREIRKRLGLIQAKPPKVRHVFPRGDQIALDSE